MMCSFHCDVIRASWELPYVISNQSSDLDSRVVSLDDADEVMLWGERSFQPSLISCCFVVLFFLSLAILF